MPSPEKSWPPPCLPSPPTRALPREVLADAAPLLPVLGRQELPSEHLSKLASVRLGTAATRGQIDALARFDGRRWCWVLQEAADGALTAEDFSRGLQWRRPALPRLQPSWDMGCPGGGRWGNGRLVRHGEGSLATEDSGDGDRTRRPCGGKFLGELTLPKFCLFLSIYW
jgi:hypothetical protein